MWGQTTGVQNWGLHFEAYDFACKCTLPVCFRPSFTRKRLKTLIAFTENAYIWKCCPGRRSLQKESHRMSESGEIGGFPKPLTSLTSCAHVQMTVLVFPHSILAFSSVLIWCGRKKRCETVECAGNIFGENASFPKRINDLDGTASFQNNFFSKIWIWKVTSCPYCIIRTSVFGAQFLRLSEDGRPYRRVVWTGLFFIFRTLRIWVKRNNPSETKKPLVVAFKYLTKSKCINKT